VVLVLGIYVRWIKNFGADVYPANILEYKMLEMGKEGVGFELENQYISAIYEKSEYQAKAMTQVSLSIKYFHRASFSIFLQPSHPQIM
jgi:hypothetical protein